MTTLALQDARFLLDAQHVKPFFGQDGRSRNKFARAAKKSKDDRK